MTHKSLTHLPEARSMHFSFHSIRKFAEGLVAFPKYEESEDGGYHFEEPLPYDDLPEDVQERVLQNYGDINTDHPESGEMTVDWFKEDILTSSGLRGELQEVSSYGDAAWNFEVVDYGLFAKALWKFIGTRGRANLRSPRIIFKALLEGSISVSYTHDRSRGRRAWVEDYAGLSDERPRVDWGAGFEFLETWAQSFFEGLEGDFESAVRREEEYQTSREAVEDTLRANEYTFNEQGRIARKSLGFPKTSEGLSMVEGVPTLQAFEQLVGAWQVWQPLGHEVAGRGYIYVVDPTVVHAAPEANDRYTPRYAYYTEFEHAFFAPHPLSAEDLHSWMTESIDIPLRITQDMLPLRLFVSDWRTELGVDARTAGLRTEAEALDTVPNTYSVDDPVKLTPSRAHYAFNKYRSLVPNGLTENAILNAQGRILEFWLDTPDKGPLYVVEWDDPLVAEFFEEWTFATADLQPVNLVQAELLSDLLGATFEVGERFRLSTAGVQYFKQLWKDVPRTAIVSISRSALASDPQWEDYAEGENSRWWEGASTDRAWEALQTKDARAHVLLVFVGTPAYGSSSYLMLGDELQPLVTVRQGRESRASANTDMLVYNYDAPEVGARYRLNKMGVRFVREHILDARVPLGAPVTVMDVLPASDPYWQMGHAWAPVSSPLALSAIYERNGEEQVVLLQMGAHSFLMLAHELLKYTDLREVRALRTDLTFSKISGILNHEDAHEQHQADTTNPYRDDDPADTADDHGFQEEGVGEGVHAQARKEVRKAQVARRLRLKFADILTPASPQTAQAPTVAPHAVPPPVVYPTVADLIELNESVMEEEGRQVALRGETQGLLEAAVGRMQSGFGDYEAYPTLIEKAAVLLHSIVTTHPFGDGNKRTSILAALDFLQTNGLTEDALDTYMGIDEQDLADLTIKVAEHSVSHEQLVQWFHAQHPQGTVSSLRFADFENSVPPRPLPVVMHPEYYAFKNHEGNVWQMNQYQAAVDELHKQDPPENYQYVQPEPVTEEDALLAHTPEYVKDVFGLPQESTQARYGWATKWDEGGQRAVLLSAGGLMRANEEALRAGVSVQMFDMGHHAYPDRGEGFCVLNDIAIAAKKLSAQGKRVMIVDTDVHQGQGTTVCTANDPNIFTLSTHERDNYPDHKEKSSLDVELRDGTTDLQYLRQLQVALGKAMTVFGKPDLAIYVAGTDLYGDDRMSHTKVTLEGLRERDVMVFDHFGTLGIPVSVVIPQGYARKSQDTRQMIATTMREARKALVYYPQERQSSLFTFAEGLSVMNDGLEEGQTYEWGAFLKNLRPGQIWLDLATDEEMYVCIYDSTITGVYDDSEADGASFDPQVAFTMPEIVDRVKIARGVWLPMPEEDTELIVPPRGYKDIVLETGSYKLVRKSFFKDKRTERRWMGRQQGALQTQAEGLGTVEPEIGQTYVWMEFLKKLAARQVWEIDGHLLYVFDPFITGWVPTGAGVHMPIRVDPDTLTTDSVRNLSFIHISSGAWIPVEDGGNPTVLPRKRKPVIIYPYSGPFLLRSNTFFDSRGGFPKRTSALFTFAEGLDIMQSTAFEDATRGKRVRISYSTVTPESAEQGDMADHGWEDEEGREFDFDPVDAADFPGTLVQYVASVVAHYLLNEGATSDMGGNDSTYYTEYQTEDSTTGEEKQLAYHLVGFTPEELSAVAEVVIEGMKPKVGHAHPRMRIAFADVHEDSLVADQDVETSPSEAQIEAGNYKKGHVRLHGLDIVIENPKGSTRSGKDKGGHEWSIKMHSDYGYIKGFKGKDKDELDVVIGEHHDSEFVYIVNQRRKGGTGFDEHKVVMGTHNEEDAIKEYLSNYDKDWLAQQGGTIDGQAMTIQQFKDWLEAGDTTKPVTPKVVHETMDTTASAYRSMRGQFFAFYSRGELFAHLTDYIQKHGRDAFVNQFGTRVASTVERARYQLIGVDSSSGLLTFAMYAPTGETLLTLDIPAVQAGMELGVGAAEENLRAVVEAEGAVYNGLQRTQKHGVFVVFTESTTHSTGLLPVETFSPTTLRQKLEEIRERFRG